MGAAESMQLHAAESMQLHAATIDAAGRGFGTAGSPGGGKRRPADRPGPFTRAVGPGGLDTPRVAPKLIGEEAINDLIRFSLIPAVIVPAIVPALESALMQMVPAVLGRAVATMGETMPGSPIKQTPHTTPASSAAFDNASTLARLCSMRDQLNSLIESLGAPPPPPPKPPRWPLITHPPPSRPPLQVAPSRPIRRVRRRPSPAAASPAAASLRVPAPLPHRPPPTQDAPHPPLPHPPLPRGRRWPLAGSCRARACPPPRCPREAAPSRMPVRPRPPPLPASPLLPSPRRCCCHTLLRLRPRNHPPCGKRRGPRQRATPPPAAMPVAVAVAAAAAAPHPPPPPPPPSPPPPPPPVVTPSPLRAPPAPPAWRSRLGRKQWPRLREPRPRPPQPWRRPRRSLAPSRAKATGTLWPRQ